MRQAPLSPNNGTVEAKVAMNGAVWSESCQDDRSTTLFTASIDGFPIEICLWHFLPDRQREDARDPDFEVVTSVFIAVQGKLVTQQAYIGVLKAGHLRCILLWRLRRNVHGDDDGKETDRAIGTASAMTSTVADRSEFT